MTTLSDPRYWTEALRYMVSRAVHGRRSIEGLPKKRTLPGGQVISRYAIPLGPVCAGALSLQLSGLVNNGYMEQGTARRIAELLRLQEQIVEAPCSRR